MKQNIIISILVVLAVLVAGYFLINKQTVENPPVNNETNGEAQVKIDINAVCEGALAYMTFTDGASADAFVTECKEGKYPEVIEKFKADMNLGAGAEI
ncbi:MAG: hypothetical protein KBD52_00495 [Candidatus Pacebacteria bacterium]|nr:hypothetical protein [Candidatus Paceibacterota bacterium]